MKHNALTDIRQIRIQWFFLALLFLILGGIIGFSLYQSHGQMESIEENRLTNLAKVVEANLGRQLDGAAAALFGIREEMPFWLAYDESIASLNQELQRMSDAMTGLRTLLILDAEGNVLAANRNELVGRNFSERDYFEIPRQNMNPNLLHLSPPFKTVLGVYAINLSLMLPGPNGEFNGIITATLDPEYFTLLLNSVLYAPDMRAALIHGDGKMFLLHPEHIGKAGMDLATPGSFFTLHRESGRSASFFTSAVSITGEQRIMALHTINPANVQMDKSLVIGLSRDLSATHLAWRRNAFIQGGLYGLLCLGSVSGLILYQRRRRAYDRLITSHLADLHQSRALLDATGHIAKIGGWALDIETQKVTWSAETYYIHEIDCKLPTPEVNKAIEYYPLEARPALLTALDECARTGKPLDLELPFVTATGRSLWVNVQAEAERENGKIVRLIGAIQDITDRKQEEEEKLKLASQLRQAQKIEAIGTLAGGIAHDFNNILSIIFGYTELAMLEKDQENLPAHLAEIKKGAERARNLVRQILTFSRKTEQQQQPLQISLIIKEALKMLRASIPTTIEIRQNVISDGIVLADPTQIHQIVMNLCTNAYHAMREAGGILAVSLEEVRIGAEEYGGAELVPGNYLLLEVSDTGCGIDQKIQDKIFEPYFTTKRLGEGTGMGLAVVHGIVKSHHGHITLYSEPGKGTSFHVYLPLTEQQPAGPAGHTEQGDLRGNGEQILFIDDEEQIRGFAELLLTKYGYQVTTFANGVRALEEFQQQPDRFALVITDMTMPYLTGAELAQKILNIRPQIPVILCTGQSELINKEKALAMGICGYLNKPLLANMLLAAIRKTLEKKKSSDASS